MPFSAPGSQAWRAEIPSPTCLQARSTLRVSSPCIEGKGEQRAEEILKNIASTYPTKVAFRPIHDEVLAHKIYASSDIFLMPSRFEPCGLSQMIAMRYGSLPIVSRVGGLRDSVVPYGQGSNEPTGFFINTLDAGGLADTMEQALAVYSKKTEWRNIMTNAMLKNFSWENSSQQYLKLFAELVKRGPKW